jgi:hypothetical protein
MKWSWRLVIFAGSRLQIPIYKVARKNTVQTSFYRNMNLKLVLTYLISGLRQIVRVDDQTMTKVYCIPRARISGRDKSLDLQSYIFSFAKWCAVASSQSRHHATSKYQDRTRQRDSERRVLGFTIHLKHCRLLGCLGTPWSTGRHSFHARPGRTSGRLRTGPDLLDGMFVRLATLRILRSCDEKYDDSAVLATNNT